MSAAFTITFFPNYAASAKREALLSAIVLADLIRTTNADAKERLPWLKCARFGDHRSEGNSLRNNENIVAITGVEADYDGKQLSFGEAVRILREAVIASLIYTSPSFTEDAPKWRLLCFFSREYPPTERGHFLARLNGLFGGIFDPASWKLSQAYFYGSVRRSPSHRVVVVDGMCIDLADHLDTTAIKPALQEAQAAQREARATRASDDRPCHERGDSLIAQIRARLPDLDAVLTSHGYARRGNLYRHPNSQSGSFGLNVATFGGIARLYSHNGNDPLHPGNLPAWTNGVTAIDAFDATVILDYGGDRTRALRDLTLRFGLTANNNNNAPQWQRLWDEAEPLQGSPGALYLETIGLVHLLASTELRFCSACPHPSRSRLPALVAAVRALDGDLIGIHRTYLRADGSGQADIDPARASLGHVMGGAIRLALIEDVLAIGELVVAEDLEEAASLGLLLGRPAWAAADVKNLAGRAGIVLPPEVRRVVLVAGDGERGAWRRFKRERRTVQTATPTGAASFNEMLGGAAHG
jgi:hypothetical protein